LAVVLFRFQLIPCFLINRAKHVEALSVDVAEIKPARCQADDFFELRPGLLQAVRLPKEFRFKDDYIFIKKSGNAVILNPAKNSWDSLIGSLDKFTADFMTERRQPKAQKGKPFW